MRDVLARVRDSVLSPVGFGTVILFLALVVGAVVLWRREISYAHPGPAIATALLAVTVFVIGLVINALQVQETPSRRPGVIGLELLVKRWQTFGPKQRDSAILYEQFSIAQSIAELVYNQVDEIRFLRYFSGFKIKGGAFLLQPGQSTPLVSKFDSLANINEEVYRYEHCVSRHLSQTPGEPWVPPQRYGTIEGQEWGVIIYSFVGPDQGGHRQLQTFAEYYLAHDDPQHIANAFNEIFKALRPWWENPELSDDCMRGRRITLYGEYNRLTRKLRDIERGIAETGQLMGIGTLQNISAKESHIDLCENLRLRNPLNWVEDVFGSRKLADRIKQHRQDSIVHGDLHAGNILISEDDYRQLRAWVIDFPHVHVGPTIQDLARLEADLKFGLLTDETLGTLSVDDMYQLESNFLPKSEADLTPAQLLPHQKANPQLQKTWEAVRLMRDEAGEYMSGFDVRPYYLALLHATLPALYYRNRSPSQKLYTFISAALLCERLGG
jgi:hypothetical protein